MKINLTHQSLIKVSGSDAENFINSQVSNNIKQLQENDLQLNAYCQHQGKIISLLWVARAENYFFLSLNSELLDTVISRLQMYKMISQVVIEDVSEIYQQIGLIDEKHSRSYRLSDRLQIELGEHNSSYSNDLNLWKANLIRENIPDISLINSEKFVPQMLNLDIDEIGVSFTKGCYPGQEVVARLHYLGTPKRRMHQFFTHHSIQEGDAIYSNASQSLKPCGRILQIAQDRDVYIFLAVIETDHLDVQLSLSSEDYIAVSKLQN